MLRTIKTARLNLRPFDETDARRIAYLAGDYDVARSCGRVPHPYSYKMAVDWLATHPKKLESGAEFPFAIELERDGLIGSIGVNRLGKTPAAPWELGYWLGKPYWGLGYATEAACALMQWAQAELGAKVFTAGHFTDNPVSGNVLVKLGFIRAGTSELFGLARQRTSRCERYVWPEGAIAARLADHGALAPH